MHSLFILLLFLLTSYLTSAQRNQFSKLKKDISKENEITRKIHILEHHQNQDVVQTCKDLEALITELKTDIPSLCALYFRKFSLCKNYDDKDLRDFEKLLDKLANECEKIIFWTNLSKFFLLDRKANLSKIYLEKAQKLIKTQKCEQYHFYLLLYEQKVLTDSLKYDQALAKMLEAENFYLNNNLNFSYDWFTLQVTIGSIYYHSENYLAVEKRFQRAIGEAENWLGRDVINSYNALGLAQKNLKKYKEAYLNFQKALKIAEITQDTVWTGIIQGNMAEIDIENKNYESAEKKLQNYLNYAYKYQEHGIVVAAYIKFAHLFRLKGDFNESLNHLQ